MNNLDEIAAAVQARMLSGQPTSQPSSNGALLQPRQQQGLVCEKVLIPVEYRFNAGRGEVRTTAYLQFDGAWANRLAELAEQLKEFGFRVRGNYERDDGGGYPRGGYDGGGFRGRRY